MVYTTLAALLLTAQPNWAGNLMVTSTADSGGGSLRWAISQANASAGADTITFDPGMAGKVIKPVSELPTLTDPGTTVNGDLGDDGTPNVALDGTLVSAGIGLDVGADNTSIVGLAVYRFPDVQIRFLGCSNCTIRTCHVGVGLSGLSVVFRPDGTGRTGILVEDSDQAVVGGTAASARNVIAAGDGALGTGHGILVTGTSTAAKIRGNYLGVKRNGRAALGTGEDGVRVVGPLCTNNTIGGTSAGARNLFGGSIYGVYLVDTNRNTIAGNWFGLGADGSTSLPISMDDVVVDLGATRNTVGGWTAGARNVFAGGETGVILYRPGTAANTVAGNWFGLNGAGTSQMPLETGVVVSGGAGAQVVGGDTASARNVFAPSVAAPAYASGVQLIGSGGGSVVRGNTFGRLPGGADTTAYGIGVSIDGVSATVLGNTVAGATYGVRVGSGGDPKVVANTFEACTAAVRLFAGGTANLGNLGNASTTDDGGNVFVPTNTWHVYNESASLVKAEGNDWGTTARSAINAKIWDKLDNPSLGLVDFSPLQGGVLPTGARGVVAALAVTGAAAVPTAAGAEITFTLSAPAQVTVEALNLAGRPVAVLAQERPAEAGVQRIAWNGQSATGAAAPAGRYLVRITARDAAGAQTTALAPVSLDH